MMEKEEHEQEKRGVCIESNYKQTQSWGRRPRNNYQIKSQIDDLVDQFFESKLEKVKNNEQMIVNYKFQPKIR